MKVYYMNVKSIKADDEKWFKYLSQKRIEKVNRLKKTNKKSQSIGGFVANILETPIAKEERLRAHRVSALKLYHAACLKDKAQREAQEAADAVRHSNRHL